MDFFLKSFQSSCLLNKESGAILYRIKSIDYEKLSKEAQNRLSEIKLYYDSLFSLRLTGTLRLFGYIENSIFYTIWYDPEHEVCPAPKKHT